MMLREYFNVLLDLWGERHGEEAKAKLVDEIDKLVGTSDIRDGDKRWELLANWLEVQAINRVMTTDQLADLAFSHDDAGEIVAVLKGDLT